MIYQEKSCQNNETLKLNGDIKVVQKFLKKQKKWRNKYVEIFLF